ncbi:hypothetical protein [Arthrobacter sp. NyZ413]|uniref:hypothetical protein n=1 Tax=Arthrobacter sp. NyZ413 TaxID=3144669 RepID=UPI002B794F00|nr:hypothetical protein [Arthrobacter sp.]
MPNLFSWLLVASVGARLLLFLWQSSLGLAFLDASASADTKALQSLAPQMLLLAAVSLALTVVTILFGFFDWRQLKKAGVVRPFHWAWVFLGGVVYMIGRAVVLSKVVRSRYLAPTVAFSGAWAVLMGTIPAVAFAAVLNHGPDFSNQTLPSPSGPGDNRAVASTADGFTASFSAVPKLTTKTPRTVYGATVTERTWSVAGKGYTAQEVTAARFSCRPTATSKEATALTIQQTILSRFAAQATGSPSVDGTEVTSNSFSTTRRVLISFTNKSTGEKLTAHTVIVAREAGYVVAIALDPTGSGDTSFIDSFHPTDRTVAPQRCATT